MHPFRIKITIDRTLASHTVGGNTLDEAKDEAIRWINNHSALRARFTILLPTAVA